MNSLSLSELKKSAPAQNLDCRSLSRLRHFVFHFLLAVACISSVSAAPLHKRLISKDEVVRRSAIEELTVLNDGKKEELVRSLIKHMRNKDFVVRRLSAEAIGHIGPPAHESAPVLIEALRGDGDWSVRAACAEALGKIKPAEIGEAVAALVQALWDGERFVRAFAAQSLGEMGVEAKEAIPQLIRLLGDEGALEGGTLTVREKAAAVLEKMGLPTKESVPALILTLKDKNAYVQRYTAWILGRMGADAQEAVSALSQALEDIDEKVRENAASALRKIGTLEAKDAITRHERQTLIQGLISQDKNTRETALQELDTLDTASKKMLVPQLMRAFKNSNVDDDEDTYAAEALERIARESVPVLGQLLDVPNDIAGFPGSAFSDSALPVLRRIRTPAAKQAIARYEARQMRRVREQAEVRELERAERRAREKNERTALIEATREYMVAKAAFDTMQYKLKYETPSYDLESKTRELQRYAENTYRPAAERFGRIVPEFLGEYGERVFRDVMIKHGFSHLLR